MWPAASIIIATYNNSNVLKKTLNEMLKLDYPKYEVIVINDGSTDNTKKILKNFEKEKNIKIINLNKNSGVCRARNTGIQNAKYDIVINMDHDCIPAKTWLKDMVKGFENPNVGIVSAYDYYGGTSTGFRKELLEKVGGYDEDYFYYREDTDLSFKIMDLGYGFKLVSARYTHDHKESKPKNFIDITKMILTRLKYHQNDVLLYKKHPTKLCENFLHIKYGFLIDPIRDFKTVTGLWKKDGEFSLSSPRGITFIKNKTILHTTIIIILGIGYVTALKLSRLIGSIRYGKIVL